MATGGQVMSSEEAFYYNCTHCSQQGRFIEARRFCVECGEYFCSTCLSCHEKFSVTKGHTLLKCEDVSKEHLPTRLSRCELHTDKEEDMVCCDHDVVCCRVCIAKDHRSCQNIDYFPDLAQKYKREGKREELDRDLNERIEEITRVHNDYTTHVFKLKTRKTTCLKRLEIFQKSLADYVKIVVKNAKKDVEAQFGPGICSMQKQIRKYEELLSKLACLSTDLWCEQNEIAEFKKILECQLILKKIKIELCAFDDKFTNDKFQNKIVESVARCLTDNQLFGNLQVVDSGKFEAPNLCVKEKDSSSFVLFVADFCNNKVRRVERDLTRSESYDVDGHIWGICEVSTQEIAFTLPDLMRVQFFSADKSPVLRKSFTTNLHCRGIAYLDEKIYVTGGGMSSEEKGQLKVFNLEGKLLGKYGQDSEGTYFSIPRSILVNTEGIYIVDQVNGIICLDLEGKQKWVCNNTKCRFPWGLSFTPFRNLLVSGRDSNNIVIVTKDGKFLGDFLNENNGLISPKALSWDKRNNYLIVSQMNNRHLKMFYISECEI